MRGLFLLITLLLLVIFSSLFDLVSSTRNLKYTATNSYENDLKREKSKPGLVTSVDRLVVIYQKKTIVEYLVALTKKPKVEVIVNFTDPSKCFETISLNFVKFTTENFDRFVKIYAMSAKIEDCKEGLILHVDAPEDKDYHE